MSDLAFIVAFSLLIWANIWFWCSAILSDAIACQPFL